MFLLDNRADRVQALAYAWSWSWSWETTKQEERLSARTWRGKAWDRAILVLKSGVKNVPT